MNTPTIVLNGSSEVAPYRILGVDPGTSAMGFAMLEVRGKTMTMLKMSVITLSHLPDHQHRLQRIFERMAAIITQYEPHHLAIEAPFFGKNVQSMLKLGRAQGVAIAAAMMQNIPVTEYLPKKIKQSVTGNGNATKEQVAAMLVSILKQPIDNEFLDATDALAAAVCHHYQTANPLLRADKTTVIKKTKKTSWESFLNQNPDKIK